MLLLVQYLLCDAIVNIFYKLIYFIFILSKTLHKYKVNSKKHMIVCSANSFFNLTCFFESFFVRIFWCIKLFLFLNRQSTLILSKQDLNKINSLVMTKKNKKLSINGLDLICSKFSFDSHCVAEDSSIKGYLKSPKYNCFSLEIKLLHISGLEILKSTATLIFI